MSEGRRMGSDSERIKNMDTDEFRHTLWRHFVAIVNLLEARYGKIEGREDQTKVLTR